MSIAGSMFIIASIIPSGFAAKPSSWFEIISSTSGVSSTARSFAPRSIPLSISEPLDDM